MRHCANYKVFYQWKTYCKKRNCLHHTHCGLLIKCFNIVDRNRPNESVCMLMISLPTNAQAISCLQSRGNGEFALSTVQGGYGGCF